MPLYEYTCRSCGKRFEVLQRLGADGQGLTCPACGGTEVAKQLSTFASAQASSSGAVASGGSCGRGGFT